MRSILLVMLLCIAAASRADVQRSGLKAAMEKGLVAVTATTTGQSYHSKALRLQVKNNSRDALQLSVDPALIFKPDEEMYQTLVLPAEEMLAVGPGGTATIEVQTFCGRANASAPGAKLTYKLLRQGDSNLIKVTQYIHKHKLYNTMGQHAVWALTDGKSLEGIIDPEHPKQSAELIAMMTKLTGRPTPEYFRFYKLDTVAGQPVFQKRILKIIANIDWKVEAPAHVSLGIYDRTGGLVQGVLDEKGMARGGYKMMVQFEAEGAPKGAYFVQLRQDEKLIKEIKVTVD